MLSPESTKLLGKPSGELDQSNRNNRILWLDLAKVYGMFLVYYGHFVEKIAGFEGFVASTVAYKQYKCIYAFHMPLFFILSGFVYRYKKQPLGSFLYQKFLTRIVPALFFNVFAIGIYLVDHVVRSNSGFLERYNIASIFIDVLNGYPFGNFLTWFLFCLFTVELLNHLIHPLLQGNLWKHCGLAVVALSLGYYFGINPDINETLPGRGLKTWYFNQALIGLSFYQLGFIIRQAGIISWFEQSFYRYVGLAITFIATVASFNINQGPFSDPRGMVAIALTSHGNFFWFTLTAITGSLWVIFLALSLPNFKGAKFFGQNTLVLLGMNFFFMDFFKPIIGRMNLAIFDNWITVTLFCTGLTVISFMVNIPVIQILHKCVPQLMGRPKVKGPLLPALLT
ncbi:acyltransferase family protein [Leptothoe kymatousa]|uniref:Acyltransferase family protein n=1 Tax=Leptothoe kymatousa TAU-MAC 1615 TaxID=2364775 RepID=A0ABS5Y1Y5_9CYAN|nr:acyltransferase family protein [Leptothoe kymatousa]MBT9311005.1 acyltransferase family protein [Leptothoe kymatousa TAU-MAC 1615]